MGEHGCRHVFTWTGTEHPRSMQHAQCAACGTYGYWHDDAGWVPGTESGASRLLAAWREVAQELAEALRALLEVVDEGMLAPTRPASLALARFDALNTEGERDA